MLVPNNLHTKTVKLPIRIMKGKVELAFGGSLPLRQDKPCFGDLILSADAIIEPEILRWLQEERKVQLLPPGGKAVVGLYHSSVPKDRVAQTIRPEELGFPNLDHASRYRYVEVVFDEPLFLVLRGTKKAILDSCPCQIPVLNSKAQSLNHAYSIISQSYQPERISRTANVFQHAYCEIGQQWVYLDDLRNKYEGRLEECVFFASNWLTLASMSQLPLENCEINHTQKELLGREQVVDYLARRSLTLFSCLSAQLLGNRGELLATVEEYHHRAVHLAFSRGKKDPLREDLADNLYDLASYCAKPPDSSGKALLTTFGRVLVGLRTYMFTEQDLSNENDASLVGLVNLAFGRVMDECVRLETNAKDSFNPEGCATT